MFDLGMLCVVSRKHGRDIINGFVVALEGNILVVGSYELCDNCLASQHNYNSY